MAELVLSASSVTTFLRCGRQWFYAYVAGVKAPPSVKAVRGIAVHRAVEVDMSQKITTFTDLPVEDMLDAYDTSWNEEGSDGFAPTDDDPGMIKDQGYGLVKLYREKVAPGIQPSAVEAPIQFTINGQVYTGQIDVEQRILDDSAWGPPVERTVIRDTKTTARTPADDAYVLNMTGYAIAKRQATGEIEADTVLDYLIATKEPKYKEIRMGGPITDEQIRQFAGIVGDVSAAIKAERYVPNGLVSGACRWCGYTDICPAYAKQNPYD